LDRILNFLAFFLFIFLMVFNLTWADNSLPKKGGKLPVINLPVPKNPNERRYLGLKGKGYFKINQIKSEAVIIAILNLYCPACQATAPAINELYHRIENNPDLQSRMKLIGIGVGNSPYEVEILKEAYNLSFPIFPDKDFNIHKILGEVRTPFFIAVKMNGNGSHEVVYTQSGGFHEAAPFLIQLLEAYGLKQKDLRQEIEDLAISMNK